MFDPKFNIVSPGADPKLYFCYTEEEKRHKDLYPEIEELFFGEETDEARGKLTVCAVGLEWMSFGISGKPYKGPRLILPLHGISCMRAFGCVMLKLAVKRLGAT